MRPNRQRGLTLIEMLIVTVMFAIILVAGGRAIVASLGYNQRVLVSRSNRIRINQFEDRLRALLQDAYLSTVTTDSASYFLGGAQAQQGGAQGAQGGTQNQGGSTNNASQSTLTFTRIIPRVPGALLASTDDFETNNQRIGPVTGVEEVSLSLTPTGQAPVQNGLFLRTQTPADGDSTQGGTETLMDAGVESISFEFWNGTDWTPDWNTQSLDVPRLPAAIRVTYRLEGEDNDRIIVIRLLHSDVTAANPVAATAFNDPGGPQ